MKTRIYFDGISDMDSYMYYGEWWNGYAPKEKETVYKSELMRLVRDELRRTEEESPEMGPGYFSEETIREFYDFVVRRHSDIWNVIDDTVGDEDSPEDDSDRNDDGNSKDKGDCEDKGDDGRKGGVR